MGRGGGGYGLEEFNFTFFASEALVVKALESALLRVVSQFIQRI